MAAGEGAPEPGPRARAKLAQLGRVLQELGPAGLAAAGGRALVLVLAILGVGLLLTRDRGPQDGDG